MYLYIHIYVCIYRSIYLAEIDSVQTPCRTPQACVPANHALQRDEPGPAAARLTGILESDKVLNEKDDSVSRCRTKWKCGGADRCLCVRVSSWYLRVVVDMNAVSSSCRDSRSERVGTYLVRPLTFTSRCSNRAPPRRVGPGPAPVDLEDVLQRAGVLVAREVEVAVRRQVHCRRGRRLLSRHERGRGG